MVDRLQELIDRVEIRELTARYNRAFDDQHSEAWASVFTEDGTLEVDGGVVVHGRGALEEMCRATGYGMVHITTDAIVTVDDDRATQTCSLVLARRTREPSGSAFQGTGRYDDALLRTAEGWRFQRRYVTLDGPSR